MNSETSDSLKIHVFPDGISLHRVSYEYMTQWYSKTKADVYNALRVPVSGLSAHEIDKRRAEFGANALPESKSESIASIFFRQFKSPLIYVLLAASGVVWYMGELVDAMVVLAVLLINSVVGAIQEGRAQNTLRALRTYSETRATVLRDGTELIIPDTDIVVGDVILLQEGEKVPADARLTSVKSLRISEAALTGESEPVEKSAEPLLRPNLPVQDQRNMVFKGTHVVAGAGEALCVAVGEKTEIGRIAQEISTSETEIPLQANIRNLTRLIMGIVAVLSVFLMVAGVALGYELRTMFATVVTLAVSVIPEGLPIAMTLVLATGVWRMSKRNALVKRLQAVEALGQARVIAVDKTGTITKNEMIVQKVFVNDAVFDVTGNGYDDTGEFRLSGERIDPVNHEELLATAKAAVSTASARVMKSEDGMWRVAGDPTEAAMLVFGRKLRFTKEELEQEEPLIAEIPFESARKYHAALHREKSGTRLSVVGAPEVLLERSNKIWKSGKSVHLSDDERERLEKAFLEFSQQGLRVVAVAHRKEALQTLREEDVADLTLIAFVGIKDGLRAEVAESLKIARDADMRVVMITGDHKVTARAIAQEAGIFREGDRVLTGEDIEKLSERELARELARTAVFARVTPEHKLKIIQGYRARGEIVAMTGDGVNDAPSLVAADLGVAMGKIGTEVAKEAADIVLLDDNFGSIVAAVEEGRAMYRTMKKVILYLFSTSIGEVGAIAGALFLGYPIPVLPSQIIWLNFVTDGFLTVSLALDPKEKGLLSGTFEHPKKFLIDQLMTQRMLIMGAVMSVGSLALFSVYLDDLTKALTMSLTVLAVYQWFNAWNCRSETESVFRMNPFANPSLIVSTLLVIGLQILAVYTPFMQKILHTTALTAHEWILILAVGSSIIVVEESRKLFVRRMLSIVPHRNSS